MKKIVVTLLVALAAMTSAPAQPPGTTAAALQSARQMMSQNNYNAATDLLRGLDLSVLGQADMAEAMMLQADALAGAGDYAKALGAYNEYIRMFPGGIDVPQARLGIADCLYGMGLYEAALKAYRATGSAESAYRAGLCALRCGRTAEARKFFTQALEVPSTRAAANFYLGVMAFNANDFAAAKRHFAQANTAKAPGNTTDYYLTAITFAEGNYERALSGARRLLNGKVITGAERAELMRIAGESAFHLGDRAEAADKLSRYIAAAPSPALSALYIKGICDFENGRYDDAVYRFTPVAEDGAGAMRQSALLYLGQCRMEQGDPSAAILAFEQAAKLDDDAEVRRTALYNYAVAKFAGADVPFASASEVFEEYLEQYPDSPYSDRVAAYLAAGYMADSDYERALRRLDAVAMPSDELLRAKQRVLYALAASALQQGDPGEADTYLQRATELGKHDARVAAEVELLKAEAARQNGKDAEAAAKYRVYLRMADKNAANIPVAYYGLGYALYSSGNATGASEAFGKALGGLDAPAAKADALNRMADIAVAQGRYAEGADLYARAYSAYPAAGDYATLGAARSKGYLRDYKGKLVLLEAFAKDFPNSALMPDALLETTQAQISLGRNQDAIDSYRTLIKRYPGTAQGRQGYLQMGMTLLDMGRTDKAAEAYRSVISLYPTSEEAAQAASLLRNLYAEQGRAQEYIDFMGTVKEAPATQPDDLAELLEKARPEERQGVADKILAQYPDSRAAEGALRVKAEGAYAAGNLPQALAYWQQLDGKASDVEMATAARLGIMRTARDMGNLSKAAEAADAILATASASAYFSEAKFAKAMALDGDDMSDDAIRLWLELAENPTDIYGARGAFEAAAALNDKGDSERALATARALTTSGTPHRYWMARAFILISDIYAARGKDFEARQYLEALRNNYPGTDSDIFMMIDSRLENDNTTAQ